MPTSGTFGKAPIRLAWFALVFPALTLNYLGQAALLLRDPTDKTNPFFLADAGVGAPRVGDSSPRARHDHRLPGRESRAPTR